MRFETESDPEVRKAITTGLRTYNDSKEAVDAFKEKRDPKWTWS